MHEIVVKGHPFERGYQHGEAFSGQIRAAVKQYSPTGWRESPLFEELGRALLSTMASFFPEYVVEMVGISKGAKIDFEEAILINLIAATNDLGSDAYAQTFTRLRCSAIGFADSDLGPVVAKTCDTNPIESEYYLLQTVHPSKGVIYICGCWVGTLWAEAGVNDQGFAIAQTAGPTMLDQDGRGIACNVVPRLLLERCSSVEEALALYRELPIAGWGQGSVLVDASGAVAVVEKSGTRQAVIRPDGDVAFCTNHFVSPSMQEGTAPIAHENITENSENRYANLHNLTSKLSKPLTVDQMKGMLRNHSDHGAICQHGQDNIHSLYSYLMLPERREMWFTDGYPCAHEFQAAGL